MKTSHRTRALALVLSLTMTLAAGCAVKTPEQTLADAQKKLAALESVHYAAATEVKLSAGSQAIGVNLTMDANQFRNPQKIKTHMSIAISPTGETTEMEMISALENGHYVSYIGSADSAGNTTWQKSPTEVQLPETKPEQAFSNIKELARTGREELDGIQTVRYDGKLSMRDAMENGNLKDFLSQLSQTGLQQENLNAVFDAAGDIPVRFWLAPKTGMFVRYEMDMTDAMQQILDQLMQSTALGQAAALQVKVESAVVKMSLDHFNSAADFEIPQMSA